ncbi:MAG: ImmA/IrrE family metallo-endopeptidase [Gammaproteobacteria bacterium]|nr:ImmA/IrrE family metallo-endopeptidase [Gammaproteobacteria bacterium]
MIDKLTDEQRKIVLNFQETTPIDIGGLSRKFGVGAYIEDLGDEISGQIIKVQDSNDKFAISVSQSDNKQEQRFTAAHELSHFLLHKDKIGDGIVDSPLYRSTMSNKIEVEANKLAADILMPYVKIDLAIEEGAKTLEDLARYFDVSVQAIKVRLGIPV